MELKEVSKKVVVLGDGKVGKTSVTTRYVRDEFSDEYTPGTTMKSYSKNLQFVRPNLIINLKMNICDMAGQKAYSRIRDSSLDGTDGVIIVSDLTRPDTISSINEFWLDEIKRTMGNLPVAYLGNKIDLVSAKSPSANMMEETGADSGSAVFLSSAKTGDNIHNVFDYIGEALVKDFSSACQKHSTGRPGTLMDALDWILDDFCSQHGEMEKAMMIVQNQFRLSGLDVRNPTKATMSDLISRLRKVEEVLLSENIAKANYEERRAVLEPIKQ